MHQVVKHGPFDRDINNLGIESSGKPFNGVDLKHLSTHLRDRSPKITVKPIKMSRNLEVVEGDLKCSGAGLW